MKTAASGTVFNFSAPEDNGFPYILFLCVLGSFLAHAATFFLFQVVYPQRVTIPQAAPRVSLLTPSSPENVALLRWIEAEDPALVANDRPPPPPGLVEVHYRPSFASPRTAPLGAPTEKSKPVPFPKAVDRLTAAEASPKTREPIALPPVETSITYSLSLSTRRVARNPAVNFAHRASAPVEPTVALIGVNEQGEVRFEVLQHPSGDPLLDAVALAHLREVRFAPDAAPLTWGFATFLWGNDAYSVATRTP